MKKSYSLYEAKARLSALVRQVREGGHVVITVHGRPAVELRAVTEDEPDDIESRIEVLKDRGIIVTPSAKRVPIRPGAKRPGALKRFLESRD